MESLPQKDRARIAMKLIESLDPGADEEAEAFWLEEAESRLADYDAGTVGARPVEEVISEIRTKLG